MQTSAALRDKPPSSLAKGLYPGAEMVPDMVYDSDSNMLIDKNSASADTFREDFLLYKFLMPNQRQSDSDIIDICHTGSRKFNQILTGLCFVKLISVHIAYVTHI